MKNWKKDWMVVCVIMAVFVSGSMVWAAPFSVSVTPEADSYVVDNLPDDNFGSEDHVMGRYAGSWSAKAYVRFDISSYTDPNPIGEVNLSFVLTEALGYLTSSQYNLLVSALLDGDVDENWDESTITWNNAPGNDTTSPTELDPTRTEGVGYLRHDVPTYNPGDVVTVSLPNYLVKVMNADTDGKVTIILTGRIWSGYARSYASKENTIYAAPTLELIAAEFLEGDANRDGVVSAGDYASVQANFGNTGDIGIEGDANLDGVVSAGDYASVQANFGNVTPVEAVPEPATMSLLAIAGIYGLRRRRN